MQNIQKETSQESILLNSFFVPVYKFDGIDKYIDENGNVGFILDKDGRVLDANTLIDTGFIRRQSNEAVS